MVIHIISDVHNSVARSVQGLVSIKQVITATLDAVCSCFAFPRYNSELVILDHTQNLTRYNRCDTDVYKRNYLHSDRC